jgi:two-component system, NtrC family, sensor kinase
MRLIVLLLRVPEALTCCDIVRCHAVKNGCPDKRPPDMQRLASMSERILGIAYELTNSLTAIVGYSEILQSLDLDPGIKKCVTTVYISSLRSLRTVEGLLIFLREKGIECNMVNINEIIEKTLSLFEYQMKLHDIKLTMNLTPNIPFVRGDSYKLQQAFFHIVMSAFQVLDAWEGDKTIFVATSFDTRVVRIYISDTGLSMDQTLSEKIFNPLLTAKPKGMGLGLNSVYNIVKAHGGSINTIQRGKGRTLSIEFPLTGQECNGMEEFELCKINA